DRLVVKDHEPRGGQVVEADEYWTFIPAWLDDSDLSLLEFRLFCRAVRRGDFYDSQINLAKLFKVNRVKIRDALESLVRSKMLIVTSEPDPASLAREDHTFHYRVHPKLTEGWSRIGPPGVDLGRTTKESPRSRERQKTGAKAP